MSPGAFLELIHAAVDGDVRAREHLAAMLPTLDPIDVQWLHDVMHLEAEFRGFTLVCQEPRCGSH